MGIVSFPFSAQAQRGWRAGQLSARPAEPGQPRLPAGQHRLPGGGDDSLLLVPATAGAGALPLVVLLHGATGHPERVLTVLRSDAERDGFLVLTPKSQDYTWDIIRGGFGPDVETLDRLLAAVFDRFSVDPDRIALAGFSDGASYALSVGLTNGELFSRLLAFSPGFMVPGRRRGRPAVFLSHGNADTVLPIERCGRRIAGQLRADGYSLDYREFDGGHTVPVELATAAVQPLVTSTG